MFHQDWQLQFPTAVEDLGMWCLLAGLVQSVQFDVTSITNRLTHSPLIRALPFQDIQRKMDSGIWKSKITAFARVVFLLAEGQEVQMLHAESVFNRYIC